MGFNFKSGNILRPDLWTTGSGSISPSIGPSFGQNGSTDENERVNDTNPFGITSVVWETRPNGTNADDGGWNTSSFSVDNTKTYRFSVWVRRTTSTSAGNFYLGYGGTVVRFSDGGDETNPYWHCPNVGAFNQNEWYLIVGHVFPYTTSTTTRHQNTGVWTRTGGRVGEINGCNIGVDCKFKSDSTSAYHRCYHYYCSDTTTRLQFYDPRVDLCDGTEPTITELLAGYTTDTGIELNSRTITVEGASFKHQKVVATGGDAITYNGQWKIHRFNNSGTFTVTGFIGDTLSIDYLMVGGGGGGGMDMGGGGGGGGVITGSTTLVAGAYSITIGGGGAGAPGRGISGQPGSHQYTIRAVAGSNTTFNGLTAYGGGYGASSYYGYTPDYGVPGNGGCGGAPSAYSDGAAKSGGTGTSGQGYAGGSTTGTQYYGAGGGGAGAVGASGNNRPNGGAGKFSNILGRPYYWGGGGGGAGFSAVGGYGGIGGGGGGAVGDTNPSGNQSIMWGTPGVGSTLTTDIFNSPGGNGGTNTGGGGGGGSYYGSTGGNGGSGIVIIRYKYK